MDKFDTFINECELDLQEIFGKLEQISFTNTERILAAFQNNRIALRHFNPTTGYGYDDIGRDTLNKIYAEVFGAESALVSPAIASGTHALTIGLFAVLRPGDRAVSITGKPYDTLIDTINGEGNGSLKDYGVKFDYISLKDNKIDFDALKNYLLNHDDVKMVYLQRSRGYEWRDSLSIKEIEEVCNFLREEGFNNCIFLDNCYGEFVEDKEPSAVGIDLLAGSLIKNPGGGIAPTGGYLVGKRKYIEQVENRMYSPSLGGEVGSYALGYRLFYQGLFIAPHTVKEALKCGMLFSYALKKLGYQTSTDKNKMPCDITTSIKFNNDKELISFIQAIQKASPIDSFLTLEPWDMPGYEDKVIMAAGCFVQGSSIELSADAPIKPPYICYMQGGITYEHGKIALKTVLQDLKLI